MLLWIVGVLTGIAALKIFSMVKSKDLLLKWYHYVIGVCWYGALMFTVLFVQTSIYEKEAQVVSMFLLIFGGALLIVTALLVRFVFRPKKILAKKAAAVQAAK